MAQCAFSNGYKAANEGLPLTANPYREYYMRRHPWSGWRSQCSNPAHSEWRHGHHVRTVEKVCEAITTVLQRRGPLYDVELGLAVMTEYDGELTGALMREAVYAMTRDGRIEDDHGRYDLTPTAATSGREE